MDFKPFVDALLTGTPLAILAAMVGVLWQVVYVYNRDKLHDEQAKRETELESQKYSNQLELEKKRFEHQKQLEDLKFEYEQKRWIEEVSRDLTVKLVEIRIKTSVELWALFQDIAINRLEAGTLSPKITKEIAEKVKKWRYDTGGFLAEETTRDASFAFQTALWEYNGSEDSFWSLRRARNIFRAALRAVQLH